MNREIKFRAWDESQKYMAYQGNPDLETIQSFMYHFGDKLLMQFTGLHDKNGKEIYEGDILTSIFGDGNPTQICFGEFTCSAYETKDLATQIGFYWLESDGTKSIFGKSVNGDMAYCEIIGNIYENPELLK